MATFISHNPGETYALGESWGRAATAGWVVALCGDLGAGKTQLVKGLAGGLGISERVHSPTFALVNVYSGGRLPLFHLDLYRLEHPQQIAAAGLEEYLRPNGVTVIEWADRWFHLTDLSPRDRPTTDRVPGGLSDPPSPPDRHSASLLGSRLRWVTLDTIQDEQRRITYEDFGG
jgi:tRNA threonylcarbamoyladenosine biosynthesis protein TsaE